MDAWTAQNIAEYLDECMTLAEVRSLDQAQLCKLQSGLHHWSMLVDRIAAERRGHQREEESE